MLSNIIDGHMHITQWLREDGRCSFDVIEDYRRDNGIAYVDNMCCSNNADLWDGYEMDQSMLGAIAKLEDPHVFAHGCLYIPSDAAQTKAYDFVSQLEELMELGMDGVKICDFKPDAYKTLKVESRLDEYEKYISYCEKYKIHMCWHVADPPYFWDETKVSEEIKRLNWFYGNGTYPTYEKLISYAYELLDSHPDLHVMLAHAFFKSDAPDEVERLLKKYPHVMIDLAPGGEMFDGFRTAYDQWHRIFREYSDRFVYATDACTCQSRESMSWLAQDVLRFLQTEETFPFYCTQHVAHGIGLEKEPLENILYKNHERAVGKAPRAIHRAALKKYIDRYLPLMPETQNKRKIEEYRRKYLL